MGETARILIIDDDENIRKVLATILEEEGYIVETAETGKMAIEKTGRKTYNLALVDIRLPDMEGIELLTRMRPTTPKMQKIIVTGFPTMQNAVGAVNRGADGYILKPFNVEKVLKIIEEQLKKQEDEKEYNQSKVAEFIETRVREIELEETVRKRKS
jgi:two-component system response regulator AtoC